MTKRINNFKLMKETEDLKTKFLKTGKWLEGYEQGKAQALAEYFKKHFDKQNQIPDVRKFIQAIEDDSYEMGKAQAFKQVLEIIEDNKCGLNVKQALSLIAELEKLK